MRRSIFLAAVVTACSGSPAGREAQPAAVPGPSSDAVAGREASKAGADHARLDGVGPCTQAVLAARILTEDECPLPPRPGEFICLQELVFEGVEASTTWAFDPDARRITSTNHYTDGRPSSVAGTYQYDAQGNLVEAHWVRPNGETSGRRRYTYDDAGRLTRIQEESSLGTTDRQLGYDDRGRVITAKTGTDAPFRYVYDDEGRLLRRERRDETGKLTTLDEYSYADGKLVRHVVGWRDVPEEITYTYDAKGNLVDEVATSEGEVRERTKRAYDAAGHVVREDVFVMGDLEESKRFRYDGKGRRTHTTSDMEGDGSVESELTDHYECAP